MQSKLMSYTSLLYAKMDSVAVDGVWSGRIIETCEGVGIPRGTYSKVLLQLRKLGCIEQVERGFRGTKLSTYLLHYPPTEAVWTEKTSTDHLTSGPTLDRLAAQVKDIQNQLGGLNIVTAFGNIEQRLQQLEKGNKQ